MKNEDIRILIVEDEEDPIRHYRKAFDYLKAKYDIIKGRADAINAIYNRQYHGVILDLNLQDTVSHSQGVEVLDHIAIVDENISTVVVSGTPHLKDAKNSFRKGALDFYEKGELTYLEICEDLLSKIKDRASNKIEYKIMLAYLCRPEKPPFWEDSMRQTLGNIDHRTLVSLFSKSMKSVYPILRKNNSKSSFSQNREKKEISGYFWSKQQNGEVYVSICPADSTPSSSAFKEVTNIANDNFSNFTILVDLNNEKKNRGDYAKTLNETPWVTNEAV